MLKRLAGGNVILLMLQLSDITKGMKKLSISKKKKQNKKISAQGLYKWNIAMAILHAVQGVIVFAIAKSSTLPITSSYLTLDPTQSSQNQPVLVTATQNVTSINLAYVVVAFFFMSAVAHLLLATLLRKWYEKNLQNHINKARWIEYSFSASTMIVGISLLSGIYDLSTLVMVFALTAIMNLMGLVMEVWNQKNNKVNWLSYWIGCLAGIVPWIVFAIYFWGTNTYGSGQIPTFVYWIYVSIFLFFNSFAINMYLQYKQVGKWKNYLYGERAYMILSLVAKSVLAWQVFSGTLRP